MAVAVIVLAGALTMAWDTVLMQGLRLRFGLKISWGNITVLQQHQLAAVRRRNGISAVAMAVAGQTQLQEGLPLKVAGAVEGVVTNLLLQKLPLALAAGTRRKNATGLGNIGLTSGAVAVVALKMS